MVEKSFEISTAQARHARPLLQEILKDNPSWKETMSEDKYNFKWFHSKVEDSELVAALREKGKMANRFPGIQGLAHKNVYNQIMRVATDIDEGKFKFVPKQFTFPQDREMFIEYQKANKGTIYIGKPVASSEGNSIVLFKELSEVPSLLNQEMVVQQYIHNPLLVDGLKFDFRVYVVIVGTNPISAFMCEEGLARFCTEKYVTPTKDNFKKFYMHLTNYSINKHSEQFEESDNILERNNATKRTITSLMLSLDAMGVDVIKLKQNIRKTCADALSAYGPLIEHNLSLAQGSKPLDGKFFQILGFDILPDADLNCYLLEINDHPSLDIYLDKDYMAGMSKVISQIDLYVKKLVVTDSIRLTKKSKSKVMGTQAFRSLIRLEPDVHTYSTLSLLRNLFCQIAPIKDKSTITSSCFEKLKVTGISKIDMSLLFQKYSQGSKSMEYMSFYWLIKALIEKAGGESQSDDMGEIISRMLQG